MRRKMFLLVLIIMVLFVSAAHAQKPKKWWQKWNNYPDVPRITAHEVKKLMLAGEKMVFIYAGYKTDKIICGSGYIPYTSVPPRTSGSKVRFKVPKNYWIMCY